MMLATARTPDTCKTVLIVDDHPIVRRGVRALIDDATNLKVIGEAGDGFDAVELAEALNPDIVVMNLSMPGLGGIEALAELGRHLRHVEILVFSQHRSERLLAEAIAAGARGYVCKSESEHLVPALEAVARHESYFSPSLREALSSNSGDEAWDRRPLTIRERQVVKFVAEGFSNKAMSRLLSISIKTIETHRAAAMRKTGTNSLSSLTLYAARNQLVEL